MYLLDLHQNEEIPIASTAADTPAASSNLLRGPAELVLTS